ncbi:hypothetical protein C8J57DRAFT_1496293 [Mycena rebaudengoi]|nr:hypothetical protein C8J57DRAFT_1496293 [Mycena rebaudengoi]
MLQLGIEYYFGSLIFDSMYPGLKARVEFSRDALVSSAEHLEYPHIEERIRADLEYTKGLAAVLFGRVSGFRGKIKETSTAAIYGAYKIQNDSLAKHVCKVTLPAEGNLSALWRCIDAEIGLPKPDRALWTKAYQHPGAIRMFEKNKAGNYEVSRLMVAIAGAAIQSMLDDWKSSTHKLSNFEGSHCQKIYDLHMLLLETMLEKEPAKYHSLMEGLFDVHSYKRNFNGHETESFNAAEGGPQDDGL